MYILAYWPHYTTLSSLNQHNLLCFKEHFRSHVTKVCPQSQLKFFTLSIFVRLMHVYNGPSLAHFLSLSVFYYLLLLIVSVWYHITCPGCLLRTGCRVDVDLWHETHHCHTINTHGLFIYHLFSWVSFIYAHIFIISPLCIALRSKVIYYWVLQPWGAAKDVSLWIIS